MPAALPVVAGWAAGAWGSAVGFLAAPIVGALGEGAAIAVASAGLKMAGYMALSTAAAALMRPNTPSSGTTLDFKPDPKAPVRGAMGYTALGGNKVFQATWGYNRVAMSLGVALSLGPIDQVTQFRADDVPVTFAGAQQEATGFYAADMWQRTTLGLPTDGALLPPTGLKYGNPGLTGWGTQNAAPGTAFAFWTMVLAKNPQDRDIFTNGVPDPRWIGRWMKVWQPRYDDTYPGGSGPQRRDDWRTWGWSENPYDHALAWVRGHYKMNADGSLDRTKRIAGIGAPDAAIDIPAFVEGMNVADANGWTISGEWSTSDGKFQTLIAMLQAGGGEPISRGAQISVMVNAPRVATYTYTRDDLIGAAEIRPLTPRRERKNTITPRYRSEANGWEYVPAGEVTSSVYRDEDRGEPRSLEIEYVHVRDARQAGQLAAYDLANLREGLTATLPSKAHLMHVHPGDCILVDVPELALAGQKFIVRRATASHQSASVTLELRSESDGKHAWALGQTANPPPSPGLSAVDPKYVPPPVPEDWEVVPRPPAPGGTSQPVIVVTGEVGTSDIASVIIEYGPAEDGPWTLGYSGPPVIGGRYEIVGLEPEVEYWISIRHVAKNGATSDRYVQGPITTGPLIAQPGGQGDMTPPGVPTGLALSSTVETNATTGEPEVSIIATWSANTETDLAGYEVEVSQGGTAIVEAAGTNRYTRRARSGSVYGIRVRAYDKAGNRSAWTTQQTVVGGLDTIPPAPPTGLSVTNSIGAFFLRWTAPGDSDVAAVEVYEAASNSTAGAELVATVPALPFGDSGVTISRPTGSIRWFFLRAIDTSQNRSTWTSGVQGTIPAINGASDVIARSITAGSIALGTLTGDLIQAQAITTDKLAVTGALPVGLTVGPTGATLGTIDTRSSNPAARVNENTTLIAPGRIQVSGTTDLTHWRDGGDNTSIRGGAIAANSVTANKLEIGARGVSFDRFSFSTSGNTLSWGAGRVAYVNDAGTPVAFDVAGGSYTYTATGGDVTWLYWPKDGTALIATKSLGTAMNAGTVLVGSYYGGSLFTAVYGKTIIDATGISTPSLSAISANIGVATAGRIQSPDGGTFFDLNNSRAQFQVGGYVKRIGSIGSGVLEWFGPASVPVGSETRTNGAFAQGTDGVVYFGNAPLNPGGGSSARRKIENYTGQATAGGLQLLRAVSFTGIATGGNVVEMDLSFQTVSFSSGLSWTGYISLNQDNGVNETFIGSQQFEFNGGQLYVNGQLASSVKIKGSASYSGAVTYRLYIQGYSSVTLFHNGSVDVSVTPSS